MRDILQLGMLVLETIEMIFSRCARLIFWVDQTSKALKYVINKIVISPTQILKYIYIIRRLWISEFPVHVVVYIHMIPPH